MPTKLNPYLSFKDNAREAMEFYKSVFGGKLTLNTFKEFHASSGPNDDDKTMHGMSENDGNKIMHGMLEADNGIVLMGADTPEGMPYSEGASISISLSGDNEAELRGYWDKLAAGASITMPLEKAPWGDTFGMLTDKFGMDWLVNITGAKA